MLDQVQADIHQVQLLSLLRRFHCVHYHSLSTQVADAIKQMPELTRLAVDPFIPTKTRTKVIESLFNDAKVSPITSRLFGTGGPVVILDCLAL